MQVQDIIAVAVIVCIVGAAAFYIIKAKKSGKKCIGCPDSGSCKGECGCCGEACHCQEEQETEK